VDRDKFKREGGEVVQDELGIGFGNGVTKEAFAQSLLG